MTKKIISNFVKTLSKTNNEKKVIKFLSKYKHLPYQKYVDLQCDLKHEFHKFIVDPLKSEEIDSRVATILSNFFEIVNNCKQKE